MAKTIKINGVNVTSLFTPVGMQVEENNITGGNEGYMMDGSFTADIIATKKTVILTCMPLTTEQWRTLKTALTSAGAYASLYYYDPADEYTTIEAMYSVTGGIFKGNAAGGEYYVGYAVTFVER